MKLSELRAELDKINTELSTIDPDVVVRTFNRIDNEKRERVVIEIGRTVDWSKLIIITMDDR